MIWTDVFMKWNPSDYGEMEELLIPISEIWCPDIFTINLKSIDLPIPKENNYAIIDYDGTIEVAILQVLTFHCRFKIIMFPFDIQNCSLSVGPWMHTFDQIDVWFKTPTDLTSYSKNSEWDLISVTARRKLVHYDNYEIPSVKVKYDILIQRKPSYYLFTFVLPCFIITTVSIIGIFAPSNDAGGREEKVTLALTTLLTMAVLITLIAEQMPKSSQGWPLLGIYVLLQIVIAAVTALFAVFIMYQNCKWSLGEPIPVWILKITRLYHKKDHISPLNLKHDFSSSNHKTDASTKTIISTDANVQQAIMIKQLFQHFFDRRDEEFLRKDWQIASRRLDLMFMILFLILNCIFTAVFLIVGYANLLI